MFKKLKVKWIFEYLTKLHKHKIKYEKGYGYRCTTCGKPMSQCKGDKIVKYKDNFFYSL